MEVKERTGNKTENKKTRVRWLKRREKEALKADKEGGNYVGHMSKGRKRRKEKERQVDSEI